MSKNTPPQLNKNDPDSLYNWIAYKVSCPEFRNPIKNYIDENCSTFVDIDENSFEQGQLFNEMNLLIENLLKDVLEEGQITQEDFLKAAERGMEDKKYKKYFNQIINFGNYTFFKSVMTKRNYQIIQMAEKQMNQENENANINEFSNPNPNPIPIQNQQQQRKEISPEIVAQMMQNEQNELNEAIKQSLIDEDEKRRIAIIEEEEMRRAIKESLEQSKKDQKQKEKEKKEEQKKEEKKKEEPKIEEPKKEEPKKVDPKKFVPTITKNDDFNYSGEIKPEAKNPAPTPISSNKGSQLQVSSKAEDFRVIGQSKNEIQEPKMPPINPYAKKNIPSKKEESKKEEIINDEKITKKDEKPNKENNIEENKNIINEPKKEERITRDFVNIFEEKKLTLAPLVHKNVQTPNKPSTLKQDLEKNQKASVQKDIEKMKKKAEVNTESAKDVIKKSLMQGEGNKKDINYMEEDDGGLLIDEDEDEELVNNNNQNNLKGSNIHFGRIAIPKDFNDKIPDYDKEKEAKLKDYREKVLKMKKEEREHKTNNQ